MNAAEELAAWLHETWLTTPRAQGHPGACPFDDLADYQQDEYRLVARRLLTDPPPCLRARD